jgi:hypothetical protein
MSTYTTATNRCLTDLTTNEGKSELTEQELSRVAGGTIAAASVLRDSNVPANSTPSNFIGEFLQALGLRA